MVVASGDDDGACRRNLDSPATRKRLIDTARSWLRFLGYFREPVEQIPFQSRLDEYCQWAKHERGLSDETVARFSFYAGQQHIPRLLGVRWRRSLSTF